MTSLLICFDGSQRARLAIERAAALFPGAQAKILHVWEPFEHIVTRYPQVGRYVGSEMETADEDAAAESSRIALEGAELARSAGLEASERSTRLDGSLAATVVAVADQLDADAIVTGTRSLRGLHELFAGSLSHQLMQHSGRPVVAIPLANGTTA
jgi:nucleotide-binding universal stress UspA family protein